MSEVTRRRIKPPLPVAHFRVFIDREEIGVHAVSPLLGLVHCEVDPELRQTVTLRRATSQDRRLFDWYRAASKGKGDQRELLIVQLDGPDGAAINVWQLQRATPVRWTGPGFDALANDIAMEELEVRYETIAWRRKF